VSTYLHATILVGLIILVTFSGCKSREADDVGIPEHNLRRLVSSIRHLDINNKTDDSHNNIALNRLPNDIVGNVPCNYKEFLGKFGLQEKQAKVSIGIMSGRTDVFPLTKEIDLVCEVHQGGNEIGDCLLVRVYVSKSKSKEDWETKLALFETGKD
jgi:hypothetical protein